MYKDRLEQEAESGLVGKVIDKAIKDLILIVQI